MILHLVSNTMSLHYQAAHWEPISIEIRREFCFSEAASLYAHFSMHNSAKFDDGFCQKKVVEAQDVGRFHNSQEVAVALCCTSNYRLRTA